MKKWICCFLTLLLLAPACALAAGFSFGLKEQRPEVESVSPLPATQTAGDLAAEIDVSLLTDTELEELSDRIYQEQRRRLSENSPVSDLGLEDGLILLDAEGVRMALYDSTYDASDNTLYFDVKVENNRQETVSILIANATADGATVAGYGVYNAYGGSILADYIFFESLGEGAVSLEDVGDLAFTLEVLDEDYDLIYTEDVSLEAE